MSPEYPIGTADEGKPFWAQEHRDGELCESIRQYSYGQKGLCPVLIGDILGGKNLQDGADCSFVVLGKLGHGAYSTVWLVRNRNNKDYLVLKILRREHSTLHNVELKILYDTERLEFSFFYTHVPTQRHHLCFVMKPAGCTLRGREIASGLHEKRGWPWDIVSITVFLEALLVKVFACHRIGIYHGDLSPSNITLGVDQKAFTPEGMRMTFGKDLRGKVFLAQLPSSERQPLPPPCLPAYIVQHDRPLASDEWNLSVIDIIDFGQGGYVATKTKLKGTPRYQPPEKKDPDAVASIQADLWSLGCVIVYGLIHDHLFREEELQDEYIAASEEAQLSIIDDRLQKHPVLLEHVQYREMASQLVHSFVRVDPAKRDAAKAKGLLANMINYTGRHLEEQDNAAVERARYIR